MKFRILKILLISYIWLPSFTHALPSSNLIDYWKENGFLLFSIPVKLEPLNPVSFMNIHTKLSLPLVYEPLVSIGSQQEINAVLAKSWIIANDQKSMIISINPDHFFSDQSEVTATDVVNSLNRVCAKNSNVFEEIKGLNGCEEIAHGKKAKLGINILDRYTLKFDIHCSPTNFIIQLSSPNLVITKLTKNGLVGSGPYILQNLTSNYLVLKKNSNSSRDNSAKNTGLVFFYTNWNELSSMLQKVKPDGSIMYKMEDMAKVKNINYYIYRVNPNITETLVLNNRRFPFNETLFRQAFAAEVYNHFNQSCIHGAHKPYGIIPFGTGGSIDTNPPETLPEVPPKILFKHIPTLKNNNITITINQLLDAKNNCEANQLISAAKKYHVDLRFKYVKNYTLLKSLYLNHQLDGFIELYVYRNREAYSTLQFFTQLGANHANITSPIIDNMLQDAISVSSSHERFKSYQKIAFFIQQQAIVVPLFYMDHASLLSKCFISLSDSFLYNPFLYLSKLQKIKNCRI